MNMAHVTCDLCGASEAHLRYPLDRGAIVTCGQCDFSYVNPRLSSAELQAKLQAWAEQDVVDTDRLRVAFEATTLKFYRNYFTWIKPWLRTPGRRLLDVGCATGALLSEGKKLGWECEGVELGLASARYASEHLGLTIHNQSLFDFTPVEHYDLVSFLEVIEHLESPKMALCRIQEILKPEGLLLLSTPNFDSLFRRMFGTSWWVINCEDEHIMFFTPASLTSALEKNGFEVLDLRTRSIDLVGLARTFRDRFSQRLTPSTKDEDHGYYTARQGKETIKSLLRKLGIIGLARAGLALLDKLFYWRFSPLHGLGEQLIVIAKRK